MAQQQKFEIGDIVFVVSGSPKMTVTFVHEEGSCEVTWFDEQGIEHKSEYMPSALTKENPNTIPPEAFQKS